MRNLTAACLALVAALAPPPAHAFGAVLLPAGEAATVRRARVVVSAQAASTTLWADLDFEQAPRDFAWVLPTPAGATVESADPSFFDWLEGVTHPVVVAPANAAATSGGGCGGTLTATPEVSAGRDTDDVTDVRDGAMGPYDVVTLDDTTALAGWLAAHGYRLPSTTRDDFAALAAQGMVFQVLRLRADASARDTAPVRVRIPGPLPSLPVELVRAGAAPTVEIVVWSIDEHRDASTSYDSAGLDEHALRWSVADGRSNYREVFADTLFAHAGRAFVVEYARRFAPGALPDDGNAPTPGAGDVLAAGAPGARVLTRLRAVVSPAALDGPLELAPAATDDDVDNVHMLAPDQVETTAMGGTSPTLALVLIVGAVVRRRRYRGPQ